MVCEHCDHEMMLIFLDDNMLLGYAYNLYHCGRCMTLCKENIWSCKSLLWIYASNDTRLYEE